MSDSETYSVPTELKVKIQALKTFVGAMTLSYFVDEKSSESEENNSCDESELEEKTERTQVPRVLTAQKQPNTTSSHQCKTCRQYSTIFLLQHTTKFPYLSPMPPITIDVLRIYYLSKSYAVNGSNDGDRLELAILDFVNRKEYSERYDLSSLVHLGFTCEVRLKGTSDSEEKETYIVRALAGKAPSPTANMDWMQLLNNLNMYGGAMFKLFEPVTCIKTVEMYLKLMAMDKMGACMKPFSGF